MTIWLTADTHFGHEAIVRFCDRPFASVAEMNRALVENILSLVAKNDILYVLGDFAWNQRIAIQVRADLEYHCDNVFFLQGNHDKGALSHKQAELLKFNHRKYLLSHYPLATVAPGITNIHGHCHGTFHEKPWQVDVGVDAVGFAPVSLEWVEQHTVPFSREDENVLVEAIMHKYGTAQQEER